MTAQYTVRRNDAPDLCFDGDLIAETLMKRHDISSRKRWLALKLYRTASGKYVCERVCKAVRQGEVDQHEASICEDDPAVCAEEKVIDFFGDSDAAKILYLQAGIDAPIDVE